MDVKRYRSQYWFLIWMVIHAIAYLVVTKIIESQNIVDFWFVLILTGFGIALTAKIFRSVLHHARFSVGLSLIFWTLINSVSIFLIRDLIIPILPLDSIAKLVPFDIIYFIILLIGFGLAIAGRVAKQMQFGSGRVRYNYGLPNIPWFGIIVVIVVLAFIIKVPYAEREITNNYHCEDNQPIMEQNILGFGSMNAAVKCIEYPSSACRPKCINDKPYCQCEAKIFDILIRNPGDWFFG